MNRDEIPKKNRNENANEDLLTVLKQGRKIGYIAFGIVTIIIIVFNKFNGLSIGAPLAMFWAYMATQAYLIYKVTKIKSYLVLVIVSSIASIFGLENIIISTLMH